MRDVLKFKMHHRSVEKASGIYTNVLNLLFKSSQGTILASGKAPLPLTARKCCCWQPKCDPSVLNTQNFRFANKCSVWNYRSDIRHVRPTDCLKGCTGLSSSTARREKVQILVLNLAHLPSLMLQFGGEATFFFATRALRTLPIARLMTNKQHTAAGSA